MGGLLYLQQRALRLCLRIKDGIRRKCALFEFVRVGKKS
jgi:hypothetical protein